MAQRSRDGPLLYIRRRPEPVDQEVAQPLFRSQQILFRIHGTKDVISGDLPIECVY